MENTTTTYIGTWLLPITTRSGSTANYRISKANTAIEHRLQAQKMYGAYQVKQATLTGGFANLLRTTDDGVETDRATAVIEPRSGCLNPSWTMTMKQCRVHKQY